jgi:hypothetical protein
MTLDKIDERLTLYKDYLPYLIEWLPRPNGMIITNYGPLKSASDFMGIYMKHGFMIIDHAPEIHIESFDEWLLKNGHEDLVELPPYIHIKSDGYNYTIKKSPLFD